MMDVRRRRKGFTLIELMIVVSIIGLLAAIAIPSFLRYQLRSKRSEGYSNLAGIAKSQKAYMAAYGNPLGVGLAQPAGAPGPSKRAWTAAAEAAFGPLGFRPEGNVFFTYDVNTGCGCTTCFTATAYGDIDGDGNVSALMYVQPDPANAVCPNLLFGFGTPVENGSPVLNQVAWSAAADDF